MSGGSTADHKRPSHEALRSDCISFRLLSLAFFGASCARPAWRNSPSYDAPSAAPHAADDRYVVLQHHLDEIRTLADRNGSTIAETEELGRRCRDQTGRRDQRHADRIA